MTETNATRAAGSSAPACSAGELTADDIKLIDNCLAHCECSLESAGTGYTALFKMACTYTRERVAEVRGKLKPNARLDRKEGAK